jgi:hypothetical protein
MRAFTVKSIPDDLYELLTHSAELNHRSINSEIIVCIERTLRPRRLDPETVLARARRLREATAGYAMSDEEFFAATAEGRP